MQVSEVPQSHFCLEVNLRPTRVYSPEASESEVSKRGLQMRYPLYIGMAEREEGTQVDEVHQ